MIDNINIIFYSTVFIIPGYIIYSTLESLVPRTKNNVVDSSLKFLTATLINYILCSLLIFKMFSNNWYEEKLWLFYIASIFVTIVSPSILGLILVKLSDKEIVGKILKRLGYNPINPIPTSWDYIFTRVPSKSWIIVTLKNGKIFYGKFSTNSFASSNDDGRDLYIEDVYTNDDDKKWIKKEKNNGVLILKDEIQSIEFFNN